MAASLGLSDHSCQIGVPAVGVSYSNIYANISPAHISQLKLAFFTNIANAPQSRESIHHQGGGGGLGGRGGLVRGKRGNMAASLGLSDHSCQIGVSVVGVSTQISHQHIHIPIKSALNAPQSIESY